METLEKKARSWYEGLSPTSIYSLKYFYTVLCKNYKDRYASIVMVETFCGYLDGLLQHLGIDIDDEDLMDNEVKETLSKLSSHQESIIVGASYHDTQDNLQQNTISPLIIDHNLCLNSYFYP